MNRTILEEGDTYDGNDGFAVDFDEIDNTTSPNKTQQSYKRNNYKIAGKHSEGETEDDGLSDLISQSVTNNMVQPLNSLINTGEIGQFENSAV